MQIRLKLVVCALLALLVQAGCSDEETATQVVISIEADSALREKLTRVDVESYDSEQVDSQGRPKQTGTHTFYLKSDAHPDGVTFPFSFGTVKNKSDRFLLVVAGFEGDQVVVEQKARVGFVAGKTSSLTVKLSSNCYQQLCAERGSANWFERSCDEQGTCSGVPAPIITDDAGGANDDGGAGSSGSSEGGSGSVDTRNDGGGSSGATEAGTDTLDGGKSDASSDGGTNSPMDGGSGASDGGAKDTSTSDVQSPGACGTQTCPTTAHCETSPSPKCVCNTGYTGNGTTCTPTVTNPNDCMPNSCAAPHTCVDGNMDFSCTCAAGYTQVTSKTCALGFISLSTNGYSTGGGTVCGRRSDGSVMCWGRNVWGAFGDGTSEQVNSTPKVIANLAGVVEIAVGGDFLCARRENGTVVCSGGDGSGQLGNGSAGSSATPVQVEGLSNVVEITAGSEHACARRMNGTVACWGSSGSGQLGNNVSGLGTRSVSPVDVMGLSNAVEIAAGVYHTCARRSDNTVVCWGRNDSGQLGNGMMGENSPLPVQVVAGGSAGSPALVNPIGLAVGEWHSCALLMGGGVACWGSNGHGELGISGEGGGTPVRVTGLTDAAEVAANHFYTCARRTNGSVSCWGYWPGEGTSTPKMIQGVSGAAEIAAGYWHICARQTNGGAVCWGINEYGEFGNGMNTDGQTFATSAVPVRP